MSSTNEPATSGTPTSPETSDERILQLLRPAPLGVSELAQATEVTATAVRQRLQRLMAQGLVQRQSTRAGRGRPSHQYSLTEKARRQSGSNFTDLALVLWREIRSIRDPDVRRGLLERLASSMAEMYADQVQGETLDERMDSLAALFGDRRIPMSVQQEVGKEMGAGGSLPVLTVQDCPYPELAEEDRSICAVEKMLFSQLLESNVRLSQCRLEGHDCCQFQAN